VLVKNTAFAVVEYEMMKSSGSKKGRRCSKTF
jgi:hypothetical protein